MKTKALAAGAALLLLALTGCSGGASASSQNPDASAASSASALPDVTGQTLKDAWTSLQSKNFQVAVIRRIPGSSDDPVNYVGPGGASAPVGTIYSVNDSDPKPGTSVSAGQKVTLYVGFTPETATPTPTPTPTSDDSTWTYRPPSSDVVYTVTSDGPINQVTVGNTIRGKTGMEQFTDQPAKFSKSYHFDEDISKQDFDFLSVNAQAGGGSTITCAISVNGYEVARQTSSGSYAMVMCSN